MSKKQAATENREKIKNFAEEIAKAEAYHESLETQLKATEASIADGKGQLAHAQEKEKGINDKLKAAEEARAKIDIEVTKKSETLSKIEEVSQPIKNSLAETLKNIEILLGTLESTDLAGEEEVEKFKASTAQIMDGIEESVNVKRKELISHKEKFNEVFNEIRDISLEKEKINKDISTLKVTIKEQEAEVEGTKLRIEESSGNLTCLRLELIGAQEAQVAFDWFVQEEEEKEKEAEK